MKKTPAQSAVLEVIRNRAVKSNTTYSNIVTRRHQFESVTRQGVEGIISKAKKHPKYSEALKLVKDNRITNFTKGATHFYNPSIPAPAWARHDEFTIAIGGHYFYKVSNKSVKVVGNKAVTKKNAK